MKIVKQIRKNKIINGLVRKILNWLNIDFSAILKRTTLRWPTSGIIDCEFKTISFKMYNECDDGLVNYFYYGFKYSEEPDLQLFLKLSKKSNCILDIGANTGLFSILSGLVNQHSNIYSFEPYRANSDRMTKNVRLNNLKNVNVLSQALGAEVGEIEITVPKDRSITDVSSVNNRFSKEIYPSIEWSSIVVPLNTIDNFRRQLRYPIDLIKCDVETFEMSVFNGGKEVLSSDKPTVIFECFVDDERIEFFNNILKQFNYYLYLIFEQGLVHVKEGIINGHHGLNFLITSVKPSRTFISYDDEEILQNELLARQTSIEH